MRFSSSVWWNISTHFSTFSERVFGWHKNQGVVILNGEALWLTQWTLLSWENSWLYRNLLVFRINSDVPSLFHSILSILLNNLAIFSSQYLTHIQILGNLFLKGWNFPKTLYPLNPFRILCWVHDLIEYFKWIISWSSFFCSSPYPFIFLLLLTPWKDFLQISAKYFKVVYHTSQQRNHLKFFRLKASNYQKKRKNTQYFFSSQKNFQTFLLTFLPENFILCARSDIYSFSIDKEKCNNFSSSGSMIEKGEFCWAKHTFNWRPYLQYRHETLLFHWIIAVW